MEPIVNPWMIYWFSTIEKLGVAAQTLMICGFTVGGIMAFFNGLERQFRTAEEIEKNSKYAKWLFIAGVIGSVFTILLPDKETMLTMLALEYVTPDNIAVVQGSIVDFVKQLSEAVKEGMK